MGKVICVAAAVFCLTAAAAVAAPPPSSGNANAPPGGAVCSWGMGTYSNGTRMCVSAARLLVCINGEWRVDETRTPFTEDVCRQDNPRAPTFGK